MILRLLLVIFVCGVISILFSHNANAQVSVGLPQNLNLTGCTIFIYNSVTIPFTMGIDHDPALSKSISYSHTNTTAALQTIGVDPQQAQKIINPQTHLTFSSSDPDNWQIVVQIVHPDKPGVRSLQSTLSAGTPQNIVSSIKSEYTGNNFCGVYEINTVPPVHIFTQAEILKIAQQEENASNILQMQKVEKYAGDAQSSSDKSGLLSMAVVLLAVMLIILSRSDHNKLNKQEENARLAMENWKSQVSLQKKNNQYNKLLMDDDRREMQEHVGFVLDQVVTNTNKAYTQLHNFMSDLVIYMQLHSDHIKDKFVVQLPEKIPEVIAPSEIKKIEVMPETEKKGVLDKVPIIGQILEKKKQEKLSNRAEHWYNEFKKEIDGKYKGKSESMFKELYPIAEKDSSSEERAKIDALSRLIDEEGKWF